MCWFHSCPQGDHTCISFFWTKPVAMFEAKPKQRLRWSSSRVWFWAPTVVRAPIESFPYRTPLHSTLFHFIPPFVIALCSDASIGCLCPLLVNFRRGFHVLVDVKHSFPVTFIFTQVDLKVNQLIGMLCFIYFSSFCVGHHFIGFGGKYFQRWRRFVRDNQSESKIKQFTEVLTFHIFVNRFFICLVNELFKRLLNLSL